MPRKTKLKTLPKDFDELLKAGDLQRLQAVFEVCDVDARGGYGKQTALAFLECPDQLACWLVAQGADLEAVNTWGGTPLHSRVGRWRSNVSILLELGADVNAPSSSGTPLHIAAERTHAEHVRLLLAHGARVDAKSQDGLTPLELALRGCSNAELHRLPAIVQALLDAGAVRTPAMSAHVERLGKTFEFHRQGFVQDGIAAADAALTFLYETFSVTPVPRRRDHDGVAPITVTTTTWQEQHAELWQLLVPSQGHAKTVQGEVVRIAGRIGDEWERNGGMNWDGDYVQMATALAGFLRQGEPLDPSLIAELESTVANLADRQGESSGRLTELAVMWVLKNPQPRPLSRPNYRR